VFAGYEIGIRVVWGTGRKGLVEIELGAGEAWGRGGSDLNAIARRRWEEEAKQRLERHCRACANHEQSRWVCRRSGAARARRRRRKERIRVAADRGEHDHRCWLRWGVTVSALVRPEVRRMGTGARPSLAPK
jgi:head-tail adaptor